MVGFGGGCVTTDPFLWRELCRLEMIHAEAGKLIKAQSSGKRNVFPPLRGQKEGGYKAQQDLYCWKTNTDEKYVNRKMQCDPVTRLTIRWISYM